MSEQTPKRLVIHSNAGRDKTRPPQTQLVGWKQYLKAMSEKGFFYSFAVFLGFLGIVLVLVSLIVFVLVGVGWREGDIGLGGIIIGTAIAALGIGAIWSGKGVLSTANEMEPVKLITRQNARFLPMRKTLVRAADPPPPDAQAELLRAAGQGHETPAEELLRATQENGQDV